MAAVIPVVSKLSDRVIRVLGCNPGPMTLQGTNTYIIGTGKRRILVDTGDKNVSQYINHLRSVLHNEDIDISHIFITHWHHDHIGGLNDVLEMEGYADYCQVWKYASKEDVEIPNNVKFNMFKDAQEFTVEGATVRVLHTPGHTTDHVSLLLLEENAVFSGDCILGEGTAVFEDLHDYINSLEAILDLKSTIIYPGHGNAVHNPHEKIVDYIQHRVEREQQILDTLKNNPDRLFNELDIVGIVYVDISEKLIKGAANNVNHHLCKLLKEKRVMRVNDHWQHLETNE